MRFETYNILLHSDTQIRKEILNVVFTNFFKDNAFVFQYVACISRKLIINTCMAEWQNYFTRAYGRIILSILSNLIKPTIMFTFPTLYYKKNKYSNSNSTAIVIVIVINESHKIV